jgi:hypothetical protein
VLLQQEHRILHVNVGFPGSVHDARVLFNSAIFKDTEQFLGGPSVDVNGVAVPQMLVADAGYPNVPWLLTPFPGHHLNPTQSSSNYKQSSTRICVEQTNADLKGVQRYLIQRVQQPSPLRLPVYVGACAVLHNMRIDMGEVMDRGLSCGAGPRFVPNPGPDLIPNAASDVERAAHIRGAIAEALYAE